MYPRERFRVVLTFLVGSIIGLCGLAIVAMSSAAIDGPKGWLYYVFYYYAPLFQWALPLLPPAGPPMLLNVPTILGFVLFLIGVCFTRYAINNHSIINEAARASRVAGLVSRRTGIRQNQSFTNVSAGRDLTIMATIEDANNKLDDWSHNFWKGPGGALVVSVVATVIAAVFTKLLGLTH
jgi:hypothetical protein